MVDWAQNTNQLTSGNQNEAEIRNSQGEGTHFKTFDETFMLTNWAGLLQSWVCFSLSLSERETPFESPAETVKCKISAKCDNCPF